MFEKLPGNHFKNRENFLKIFDFFLVPKICQKLPNALQFVQIFFLIAQNHPETISGFLYSSSAVFLTILSNFTEGFKNYTENNVKFLKQFSKVD